MEAWGLFPIRLFTILMVAALVYYVCDHAQRRVASGITGAAVADNRVADADATPPRTRHVSTAPVVFGVATFFVVMSAVEFVRFRRFTYVVHQIETLGGSIRFDPSYWSTFGRYFAKIATLDLSDSSVDDSNLPPLRCIHNLKSARLANTRIGPEAIRAISKCHSLESLDISNTAVVDDDLVLVARIRKLRSLLLNDTKITDGAVAYLSKCRKLKRLELTGTALSENGYRQLIDANPIATVIAASVAT